MSPLVAIDSVQKLWDESSGLRRLTMTIEAHELVVVQGRSGTGKSTLLALLAGWCEPDAGSIVWGPTFDGHDVTRWDQVAIVPQVLGLVGELSTRENVELALRGRGTPLAAAREQATHMLEALELTEVEARPPHETSLGQRQRAALARALAAKPTLLLADEPTSHQDAATARRVVSVIRARAEAGSGVLVTTHDEMVAAAADRVVTLD
jgi:putative ABC transport system ATP-binding protein